MATLTRFEPFREMMEMRNVMDRLFSDFVSDVWPQSRTTAWLPLDIKENEDEFVVLASIPGVNPDDLDITLTNNVLTIQGEIPAVGEDETYYLRERHYGKFYRSIQLPATVKADAIEAEYVNGVLTLHLPKAEEAKPKHIPILTNGHKTIEGKAA